MARRIPDLAPADRASTLNGKLRARWQLDFAQFRVEVKRAFKQDIPLADRAEWEHFLADRRAQVRTLDATIAHAEAQLDAEVYALFRLSGPEIALLESAGAGTPRCDVMVKVDACLRQAPRTVRRLGWRFMLVP